MNQSQTHVVVVGGGVIGVCCAYYLAKRGASVTLLERDQIGVGASYGNAGTVAPGHAPITKPGRVKQALQFMLDPTSPLYIAPRWDPALMRWLWIFRRHCTAEHLKASMHVLGPLGHDSRELFDQLVSEEDLDCDYNADGYYDVFRTAPGLAGATNEAALMWVHGYRPMSIAGEELREREPALRRGVQGGIYYPEAATMNPHRFVLGMADRAAGYGATVCVQAAVSDVVTSAHRVTGVRLRDGEELRADAVILATGAYSLELAAKVGYRLPIQAGKGYHRDRKVGTGGAPSLQVTCMLGERSVFCTPMSGFVRFAGTMEFSGFNHEIRGPRLEQLTESAKLYLTGVGDTESRSEWCGLRPCTPDGLPIVGPVPGCDGLHIATGHAMLGLTLGPVTGKLVAEALLDESPSRNIDALRVDRF
jgi:D-amino-acid dehydrogenase